MNNIRATVAKGLDGISSPKVSKPFYLVIGEAETQDPIETIEISRSTVATSNDVRIQQSVYDMTSPLLPLRSSVASIDYYFASSSASFPEANVGLPLEATLTDLLVNPFALMDLQNIDTIIPSFEIHAIQSEIQALPEIAYIPFSKPQLHKVSVFGMNYADKHWQKYIIPDETTASTAKSNKSDTQKGAPVQSTVNDQKRKQKAKKQEPSFWDLLFAILQPPLTFNKTDNLFLPSSVYPYQWQGIKFLFENDHALLADDMGTGKTVMTIVTLKLLIQSAKVHTVLILCPRSVLYEWKQHLDDWAPEITAYLIRHPQRDSRRMLWETPMHVYITTYDTLRGDIENGIVPKGWVEKFDVMVLDEAHHIKNMKSKRFRAIKKLRPRRRWALTGTPVQNSENDLKAIFEFVYPSLLKNFEEDIERIKRKIKPYFLRRTKKDVMPELPPKTYEPIFLELDEDQEAAYMEAESGIQAELSALGDKVTKKHIFAKLTILKQICNFAPGKLESPKTDVLKQQIEEIIASKNKVIIFSQYVEEGVEKLDYILRSYGIAKIVGGQTDARRQDEIKKFKKDPNTPILIASVRSGGEGLNLTEASYVVHFDHWWNPAVMWQAEDRVHRRGQTRGVNIYSYWMKDTIEERIQAKLKEKGLLFERIIDGLAEERIMDESFTVDDWLEIFGVKKVKKAKSIGFDTQVWQSMSLPEIRERLLLLKPSEFEDLVKELMFYLGYENVKVTGQSHDGGIDITSTRFTNDGIERIVAQCKRYSHNVGAHAARDFFGAISNDTSIKQGFLITTGGFTKDCLRFCRSTEVIRTINGIELARYIQQFGLKPQSDRSI